MSQNPKKITRETLDVDSSWEGKEKDLKEIIARLSELKPESNYEEDAASALRVRLDNVIRNQSTGVSLGNVPTKEKWSWWNPNQTFIMAGAAAVVMFVIFSGFSMNQDTLFESAVSIAPSSVETVEDDVVKNESFRSMVPYGKGGIEMGVMGMNVPLENLVRYRYVGDDFSVKNIRAESYERSAGLSSDSKINSLLKELKTGLFDTKSLNGPSFHSYTLVQEGEFGYMIFVNIEQGSISFTQNWEMWPQITREMSQNNLPTKGEVIAVAEAFLKEYKIPKDDLGEPIIENEQLFAVNVESSNIPEEVVVVYPFQIFNRDVFNESGQKDGMIVSVNINHMRVSGVQDLISRSYISSPEVIETDSDALLRVVQDGLEVGYSNDNSPKNVVDLGTPVNGYVRDISSEGGKIREVIYPALIFPVTHVLEGEYFNKKNIVVPLIKEKLNQKQF